MESKINHCKLYQFSQSAHMLHTYGCYTIAQYSDDFEMLAKT